MSKVVPVIMTVTWLGASALILSACWPYDPLEDCARNLFLACFSSGVGASSGAGGDGGTPAACIPSENDKPVDDSCGEFVSSSAGNDDWDGSKANPLKTIAAAVEIAAAKGGHVYACAEDHAGSVTLKSGVKLYGGLDCASGWAYVGGTKRSVLEGSADKVALTITSSEGAAEVVDFTIRALDAQTAGGSSIAVLAEGVTAALVRCELVAGNGAAGATGAMGDPEGDPAAGGTEGNNGKNACSNLNMEAIVPGGAEVYSSCGSDVSIGGFGGHGAVTAGKNGAVGQTGSTGEGGVGELSEGAPVCGKGGKGSDGEAGTAGAGAVDLSSISASGYTGTSGGAGTSGKAGQGGGGGGGAKGGKICSSGTVEGPGASGGSGGGGGCGGLPGQGGGPGGASIALVSLKAKLTLTDTTLTAAKGGDGGPGGDAQHGGSGGLPGQGGSGKNGSKSGCSGGEGGKGGDGGPGGGGLGGPSLGVAFQGTPPQSLGKTTVTPGTPGEGGKGGSENVANNAGAPGIAAEQQELP